MDMHELHRTEELLIKGLKELNDKGELNNNSLEVLGKTLDAVKDLCEIKEKSGESYGSSGMWTAEGSYGRYYGNDRHDRMYDNRRYGEGRMYYGHNEDMVERLRRDLQNASSESEREYIRKLLRQYEN